MVLPFSGVSNSERRDYRKRPAQGRLRWIPFGLRNLDLYRGARGGEPGGDGDDARLHRPGDLDGI
jgi:hypothetical protein